MIRKLHKGLFANLKADLPASIMVFLVALPLCLGIALASGAPLFSGLISGIIGGIVVGIFSKSPLGVSGPAAGLAVIVLQAITELGGFETFLLAVVIAGLLQLAMGFARAGIVAYYFPSSVIHGMLAGIGILIFLKQIPHLFGYDGVPLGDFFFHQVDGQNTLNELVHMLNYISPTILTISAISLGVLLLWETKPFKSFWLTKLIQAPLVVVVFGVVMTKLLSSTPELAIASEHLVSIPIPESFAGFISNFTLPNFSALGNPLVYTTAITLAVVASLETLLCVEATDKQDPFKRITPANQELKAQGIANVVAGLIGGLPITQVIVRSSANQQAGGKSKLSTILHGIFLLLSIIAIPKLLNLIPLGVLAAILLTVGYKLARPSTFKRIYNEGMEQFFPFVITVLGIVFIDLLSGIALGMVVAIFLVLRNNYRIPFTLTEEFVEGKQSLTLTFPESITFLNKAAVLKMLRTIPDDSSVVIDASRSKFIHHDVVEIVEDFNEGAVHRNLKVKIKDLYKNKQPHPLPPCTVTNKKK